MAGTRSQIYIQLVFAVGGEGNQIGSSWEEKLFSCITRTVTNHGQTLLAINGMPDHIHMLVAIRPSCCLSDLVREVKTSSGAFINEQQFSGSGFRWQEGYGAFSYAISDLDNLIAFIGNQKNHHKKQSFKEEYIGLLREFDVEFTEENLFNWANFF